MDQIQQTYIDTSIQANRADLDKDKFERLIAEKGRTVIHEKALVCPCKSPKGDQRSTCKNCGGTGFIFVNPQEARMVLTGFDAVTKLSGWSEELRGMTAVTASADRELTYMDRITAVDAEAIYNEVLFFRDISGVSFAYSAYKIKEVKFAGLFVNDNAPLQMLTAADYTIDGNRIKLTSPIPVNAGVTFRYKHAPSFHVVEMKRETMQSFMLASDGEKQQYLPVSGYARRAHFVMDKMNINGSLLLDNNFQE